MKLKVTTPADDGVERKQLLKKMQAATVGAMNRVVDEAKAKGRTSIAGGGFSGRWQNALRSRVYPNESTPLSPAGIVWHKIKYWTAFQDGATVSGKPMLWLPLPDVPRGQGTHPLTPKQYRDRIGPLRSVNRPGKPPMLVGRGSRASITRATATKVSVRKRAVKKGAILGEWVPLFIGVPKIVDPKRFDIRAPVKRAAEQFQRFYADAMGE